MKHPMNRTVPCETCGTPTLMTATKRCDPCWEFERRYEDYLRRANREAVNRVWVAVGDAKARVG